MISNRLKNICTHVYESVSYWTKYNSDIDQETNRGACAIASYTLYKIMKKYNYNVNLICLEAKIGCHCWIEWKNYILDLTVKQFETEKNKLPDIIIENKNKYKKIVKELQRDYWKKNKLYKNKTAIEYIMNWPYEQSPRAYKKEIDSFVSKYKGKSLIVIEC